MKQYHLFEARQAQQTSPRFCFSLDSCGSYDFSPPKKDWVLVLKMTRKLTLPSFERDQWQLLIITMVAIFTHTYIYIWTTVDYDMLTAVNNHTYGPSWAQTPHCLSVLASPVAPCQMHLPSAFGRLAGGAASDGIRFVESYTFCFSFGLLGSRFLTNTQTLQVQVPLKMGKSTN